MTAVEVGEMVALTVGMRVPAGVDAGLSVPDPHAENTRTLIKITSGARNMFSTIERFQL
jgi:hypothetical protein